jgi:hypothetical protein
MLDRETVLAVLRKRFPGAGAVCLAEAANAIVGLEDTYEEIALEEEDLGYHASVQCLDICALAERIQPGDEVRIFRKRRNE